MVSFYYKRLLLYLFIWLFGTILCFLGAGCGLTSLALLARGYDVICTDRASVVALLRTNLDNFNVHHSPELAPLFDVFQDVGGAVPACARVLEFDWNREFPPQESEDQECTTSTSSSALLSLPVDQSISTQQQQPHDNESKQTAKLTPTPTPTGQGQSSLRSRFTSSDASSVAIGRNIDLIVCSDCLYSSASVKPLVQCIQQVHYFLASLPPCLLTRTQTHSYESIANRLVLFLY